MYSNPREYSLVANRRGIFIYFLKLSSPPALIRTPSLIDFQKKIYWSGRFYSWFALSSILSMHTCPFDAFLPGIIHLMTWSIIGLLWFILNLSILDWFPLAPLSRPSLVYWIFENLLTPPFSLVLAIQECMINRVILEKGLILIYK